MEPNILDLRQYRCPMTLLLTKRHTSLLAIGQTMTILISDSSSVRDVQFYLQQQGFLYHYQPVADYFSLSIVKETLIDV